MSPTAFAARRGVNRGRIEFGNSLRTGTDVAWYIVSAVILVVVLFLNRNNMVEGTDISFAQFMLPGVLALSVFVAGAFGIATVLATEREDGTLLRLKAVPYGTVGYVAGQLTRVSFEIALSILLTLIPALLFIPGLLDAGVGGVLEALGFIVLGLFALVPIGLVVGSVFRNPRSVGGWGMLVLGVVIWLSGTFSPLATMAGWMQAVGQFLPTYWLGLGLRAALLPDAAVVVEIGQSWRTLTAVGVLVAWAVVGLALAPVLLRRMARRESGSAVAARREKQLQRV